MNTQKVKFQFLRCITGYFKCSHQDFQNYDSSVQVRPRTEEEKEPAAAMLNGTRNKEELRALGRAQPTNTSRLGPCVDIHWQTLSLEDHWLDLLRIALVLSWGLADHRLLNTLKGKNVIPSCRLRYFLITIFVNEWMDEILVCTKESYPVTTRSTWGPSSTSSVRHISAWEEEPFMGSFLSLSLNVHAISTFNFEW